MIANESRWWVQGWANVWSTLSYFEADYLRKFTIALNADPGEALNSAHAHCTNWCCVKQKLALTCNPTRDLICGISTIWVSVTLKFLVDAKTVVACKLRFRVAPIWKKEIKCKCNMNCSHVVEWSARVWITMNLDNSPHRYCPDSRMNHHTFGRSWCNSNQSIWTLFFRIPILQQRNCTIVSILLHKYFLIWSHPYPTLLSSVSIVVCGIALV